MGCSKSINKTLSSKSIQNTNIETTIVRSEPIKLNYGYGYSSLKLKFKYLGSGGYYFSNGKTSFLIDPFFSPYGMVPLNLRRIATKPANVAAGLSEIESDLLANGAAIFITHSHYDHLMDAPYVFNHYFDSAHARIYGSESTKNIIKTVVDSTRIHVIADKASSRHTPGEWIYLSDSSIRVLPVSTQHAPHYKKLISISLYGGQAEPIKKYNSDLSKISVTKWKEGNVYGYLIDFLEDNSITFRVYLLSSASSIPNGMVYPSVLAEHVVDLAILGSASFDNVENYPEGIIDHIKPSKLFMAHWEDLFKPYLDEPPRFIRATNFKELIPRIEKIYPWKEGDEQRVFFPYPGLDIEIYF